jgi:UDP-N-acetylglucosamine 1-carboxyvinyltransferase
MNAAQTDADAPPPSGSRLITIRSGPVLAGTARVDGSKNAALPMLAAAAACRTEIRLTGVPASGDVQDMLTLLRQAGFAAKTEDSDVTIWAPTSGSDFQPNLPGAALLRASYYLVPALLARFGRAHLPWPGGCDVGHRGMELHFEVYKAFGDAVTVDGDGYAVDAGRSRNGEAVAIRLPFRSRGATIAAMLRSVSCGRPLVLTNPNLAPETRTTAAALADAGHAVRLRTSRLVVRPIAPDAERRPVWAVPGDKIEAGTLLIAMAVAGGAGTVVGAPMAHLQTLARVLAPVGVRIDGDGDTAHVRCREPLGGRQGIKALSSLDPEGLDADFEPLLLALGLGIPGRHQGRDEINPGRHANLIGQLRALGADIHETSPTGCLLDGPQDLLGAEVSAVDIRTGAALILAGLTATGTTVVHDAGQIHRGYADLAGKLRALGADIDVTEAVA